MKYLPSLVSSYGLAWCIRFIDKVVRAERSNVLIQPKAVKMAVNTLLLDFTLDPSQVKNDNQVSTLMSRVEGIVRDFLSNVKPVNSFHLDGSCIKVLTSDHGTMTTLRVYNHGLLTINIEYYRGEGQEPVVSFEVGSKSCHDHLLNPS